MSNRPGYAQKAFRLIVRGGSIIAQAWPRKRGLPKQSYQQAGLKRMSAIQRAVKYIHADERNTMRDGLQKFLDNNEGVRGTAAIRLRDWFTMNYAGRAWAVDIPGQGRLYSDAVYQDCSDFLDLIEPKIGSILTVTPNGWAPTTNCKSGMVLVFMHSMPSEFACPPAKGADYFTAVGGFPYYEPEKQEEKEMPIEVFDMTPLAEYNKQFINNGVWQVGDGLAQSLANTESFIARKDVTLINGKVGGEIKRADDLFFTIKITASNRYVALGVRDNNSNIGGGRLYLQLNEYGSKSNLIDEWYDVPSDNGDKYWGEIEGQTVRILKNDTIVAEASDSRLTFEGQIGIGNKQNSRPQQFKTLEWEVV